MRKSVAKPQYFKDLQRVTTVPTVAELWHFAPSTVRYHCERGTLAATKDGQTWLISLQSVIDLWGVPKDMPQCDPFPPLKFIADVYKAS